MEEDRKCFILEANMEALTVSDVYVRLEPLEEIRIGEDREGLV